MSSTLIFVLELVYKASSLKRRQKTSSRAEYQNRQGIPRALTPMHEVLAEQINSDPLKLKCGLKRRIFKFKDNNCIILSMSR